MDILEEFRRHRGSVRRTHEILAREDPQMLETFLKYHKEVYNKPRIPPKTKELITLCVSAALLWPGTKAHVNKALDVGLTKEEIVEALEITSFSAGMHSLFFGLVALDDVIKAREDKTISKLLYEF